jgi:hypothetical protein
MNKSFETPSRTSPRNSKRGCLCKDGKRYSRKCCDGTLRAQGIGKTRKVHNYMLTELREFVTQEGNGKIIL